MDKVLSSLDSKVTEASSILDAKVKTVNIRKYNGAQEAQTAAAMEASSTGGIILPAVMFQQGERLMLATAFPIPVVRTRLQVNHAVRKGNVEQVRSATNRPVMSDHVDSVKNYIKDNIGGKYIIPPMTLNVRHAINVYMPDYSSRLTAVWVVLPASARMEITDGGHRKAAVDKLLLELDDEKAAEFDRDSICVMITVEDSLSQIHQDFADASKTKALPKSQLAAYDRRNPANGLVIDLVEKCPLFTGKIDSTSSTLSTLSANLFLTNQVRQMVKELLTGQYAMADEAFEVRAKQLLGDSNDNRYAEALDKFSSYINRVTDSNPVLAEIARLPEGVQRNRITELRKEGWVCLTATGLVVIGRIGYELFKNGTSHWEDYADRLGKLDWKRDGALWQGNIIQNNRVMTQQVPVRSAVANVKTAIGLAAPL